MSLLLARENNSRAQADEWSKSTQLKEGGGEGSTKYIFFAFQSDTNDLKVSEKSTVYLHITADKKRERKGKEKKEEREKVNYAGGVIEMKTGGGGGNI